MTARLTRHAGLRVQQLPPQPSCCLPPRTASIAGSHVRHPSRLSGAISHNHGHGHNPCTHVTSAARRAAPTPAGPSAPAPTQPSHGLVGSLPFDESEYLEVAAVSGAHGVAGELRLEVFSDQPDKRFKEGKRLFLLPPRPKGAAATPAAAGLQLIPVTVRGVKQRPRGGGQEMWMVALREVTSRTQAEQLRGYTVFCSAGERAPLLDPDEFYVSDLIGCSVVHQATGRMVGMVVDVYGGTGTHDTLRVKLRATEQDILNSRIRYCSIPFAKAICPGLDLSTRTLTVDPPEGLLELATEEPLRKPLSEAAKAQKLQQLREQLRAEREAAQQQQKEKKKGLQPGGQSEQGGRPEGGGAALSGAAAAAAQGGSGADGADEEGDGDGRVEKRGKGSDEGEEEDEGGAGGRVVQARRPRVRGRSGGLRLGARRRT